KRRVVLSEPSSGTSSETGDTWMLVSRATFTLPSADSHGLNFHGPEILKQIERSLINPSTGSIVIDIWRKSSATALTMQASPSPWPSTPSSKPPSLPPFKPSISTPSPLTSDGMERCKANSYRKDITLLSQVGVVGSLVVAMTTLLFEKPSPTDLKVLLVIFSIWLCSLFGASVLRSYFFKSTTRS